jgi:hypothetical protein
LATLNRGTALLDTSPEAISGVVKKQGKMTISAQSIAFFANFRRA